MKIFLKQEINLQRAMTIITRNFSKGSPIQWFWPLHVAAFPESDLTNHQLLAGHWSGRFTVLWSQDTRPTYPSHPSVLLFTNGVKDALEVLDRDGPAQVEFSAILVLEPKMNDWLSLSETDSIAEKLLQVGNSRGLFVIQHPDDLAKWFDDLVV